MTDGAYLYILRCADGSYYIGTTRIARITSSFETPACGGLLRMRAQCAACKTVVEPHP